VVATPFLKRRQQVLKPRDSPEITDTLKPSLSAKRGQHRRDRQTGEGSSIRPGSKNEAKAQDGSPGNLGDPAHVHVQANRQIGSPVKQRPWPGRHLRPKTKGKVERPFRYIRQDFFLGGSFRNLDDLNIQLRCWLDTVANPRVHATTQRVVNEAFAEEKPSLKPLPLARCRTVLKLERRLSHVRVATLSSAKPHDLIARLGGNLGNIEHRVSIFHLLLGWKFIVVDKKRMLPSFVVTVSTIPPSAG
jgi:hypothetical protein